MRHGLLCLNLSILVLVLGQGLAASESPDPFVLQSASYLGGSGDHDTVVGVHITADGHILVAANIGLAEPAPDQQPPPRRVAFEGASLPPAMPERVDFDDTPSYLLARIAWVRAAVSHELPETPVVEAEDEDEGVDEDEVIRQLRGWLSEHGRAWQGGAVLRLSPDGRQVLSVARVADRIADAAFDGEDRVFLACQRQGLRVVDSDGVTRVSTYPDQHGSDVFLVDVTPNGTVVIADGRELAVLDNNGTERARFGRRGGLNDLAIHAESRTIYQIGTHVTSTRTLSGVWRGFPVHICWLQAVDINGNERWQNYGWTRNVFEEGHEGPDANEWVAGLYGRSRADFDSDRAWTRWLRSDEVNLSRFRSEYPHLHPRWLNRSANNMADTRGDRLHIGRDGLLYAGFEAAGGNHIFRWHPQDIMRDVQDRRPNAGEFHAFVNTAASHKTVVGVYDPATGDVIRWQQFNTVVMDGSIPSANALRMDEGALFALEDGTLLLGGGAASGLPMPPTPRYRPTSSEQTFNPLGPAERTSGGYLIVMDPDLRRRRFVTRLSSSSYTHAVTARRVNGRLVIVMGGEATLVRPMFTHHPFQPTPGWGEQDGFIAVFAEEALDDAAGDGPRRAEVNLTERMDDSSGGTWDTDAFTVTNTGGVARWSLPFGEQTRVTHDAYTPYHVAYLLEAPGADPTMEDRGRSAWPWRAGGSSQSSAVRSRENVPEPVRGVGIMVVAAQDMVASSDDRLSFDRRSMIAGRWGQRGRSQPDDMHGHFLVRADGQWWVSEQTVRSERGDRLTFDSDDSDGHWAPIDLMDGDGHLRLPTTSALQFQEVNFDAIEYIGGIHWRDNPGGGRPEFGFGNLLIDLAVNHTDNQTLIPDLTASPSRVTYPNSIIFDATASHDPDGQVSFVSWNFGPRQRDSGLRTAHTFTSAGPHRVRAWLWDDDLTATDTFLTVDVVNANSPDPDRTVASFGGRLASGDLHAGRRAGDPRSIPMGDGNDLTARLAGRLFNPDSPLTDDNLPGTPLYGLVSIYAENLNRGRWANIQINQARGHRARGNVQVRAALRDNEQPRAQALLYIDRRDFLGDARDPAYRVELRDGDAIALRGVFHRERSLDRFVVRNGDQFYVSQIRPHQTSSSPENERWKDCLLVIGETDTQWAPYDPSTNGGRFLVDHADWQSPTFDDVTAVGIYSDNGDEARFWFHICEIDLIGTIVRR